MPTVDMFNISGKSVGSIELDDAIWGAAPNEHLIWEVVKWQQAKRRQGTASSKTTAMVKASTKKPYKQKGTGRARQGSTVAHHHVGGGKAFGPHPRSYDYALPKKVRKGALAAALSMRLAEKKVVFLDGFSTNGKTKEVLGALAKVAGNADRALIVDSKENATLVRGTRNLTDAKWLAPEGLNVYDLLRYDTLVITQESVKQVEAALKR